MTGDAGDAERTGILAGIVQRMGSSLATALEFALVSSLSFSLALFISSVTPSYGDLQMVGAMWAMISGIIVTQDTRSQTITTAWFRVLGSLIGAVFSALYLIIFPFSIVGLGLLIGIVVFTCLLLRLPGHLRLAALTAGIVLIISAQNPEIPPFVNAALRFLEVIIGSTVAVAAAWVWQYFSIRPGDQGPVNSPGKKES